MTAAQTKNVRNNTPLKRGKKKVVWAYRSKWLSLTRAIKHLQTTLKISEQEAWLNIQQVIADGQLNARGLADGVRSDLQTTWLSILMWNDPRGDVLWFKEDKRMQASAPRRIEQIEIDGEQLSQFFEKKVPNLNLKHQTIVRKTPGRPKGVGAINDQKALDRIKELHAAYEKLGIKTICESVASEMAISEKNRASTVDRWRRKYRQMLDTKQRK